MNRTIKNLLENIIVFLITATVIVAFFWALLWIINFSEKISCTKKYWDVQYTFLWWCKINYKWKYIPEELFIKAFEQNLNIK